MSLLATLLLLAAQDNDHLIIHNEVSETFERQWAADEESRNYKDLLVRYAVAHDTLRGKLAKPDPEVERWIPLDRVLAAKLVTLPPSVLEVHEIVARQELETALEPAERRKAIEKFAYTKVGREALDLLSNADGDQGHLLEAMRGWSRALEVRPTAETVARLALAHAARNDGVSLATLRSQAESRGIKGEILVEGHRRELFEYLDSLHPAQRPPEPRTPPLQAKPEPTGEIALGHYDLRDDGHYGELQAVSLPAAGRANGRDLILVSNGLRVTALAPGRAEGGSIDDAVEWRYPRNGPTRDRTLNNAQQSLALPYVGATVSGNLAFCPMIPESLEAHQQVGRRPQKFLGASVLRALDLSTGESVWDTDSVRVEAGGSQKPLVEHLGLEKSDFCFGGPPVVHGDRLYAAIMTSPWTGRQCWVLCLDPRTGQPIWCTDLGTAPQSKEMSVALLAEEDGTVVVSTNYGVIAALESATGGVEWVVKYMNATRPMRSQRPSASPPLIVGSLVYVLTQDYDELLAFDRWTGLEAALPKPMKEIPWREIIHFIGRAGDWLVFSGPRNVALRPLDGQVIGLLDSEPGRFGRGTITGARLYLPTSNDLTIFDTETWQPVDSFKWPESKGPGNAIVAGPLFVHMSSRLDLYTSLDLLRDRFGLRDGGAPGRPQDCRQVARIFESAGLLKESVPYYRRALKLWEKDPAWQETAEGLRKKLADLAEKLGDEFPKD